jgi:hypothetical protein
MLIVSQRTIEIEKRRRGIYLLKRQEFPSARGRLEKERL